MLRLSPLICSRVIQYAYPEPRIPALFVFDRTPLGDNGGEWGRRDRKKGGDGQEGGRTLICAVSGGFACAVACASHSNTG
eukprot:227585-Pyramimonas_sp.AAC.1